MFVLLYFENDEFLGEYIVTPPWHMIDIDCFFMKDIPFDKISVDLQIKDDISADEFLYIAPFCGRINGINFYAGIQTQCGGYVNPLHNEQNADYHEIGKAMIFSRWDTRNIKALQKATNGVCESSGYEGDSLSYQLQMSANPGNSGAPVFDNAGEVIGVLSTREAQLEGVVFALKSNNIYKVVRNYNEMNDGGKDIKISTRSNISRMSRKKQIATLESCVYYVKSFDK